MTKAPPEDLSTADFSIDRIDPKITKAVKELSEEDSLALQKLLTPRIVEPYFVHNPHPVQRFALCLNSKELLFGGAAGGGKALALDTPILTTKGWSTMGGLSVGEYVYDENGEPTRIVHKSPVMEDHRVLRVHFSDGSTIDADEEHLWNVVPCGSRRAGGVLNTATIAERTRHRSSYAVLNARPIQRSETQLPIDPYLFGYWIGDGDTRRGYLTIGSEDREAVAGIMADIGEVLTPLSVPTHFKVEGLTKRLISCGVVGPQQVQNIPMAPRAKSIPREFLEASERQRWALLQGIVDSDGYVDEDVELTTTSSLLADQYQELLVSLGIKVSATEGRATLDGRDIGPKYRLKFLASEPVARLPRKLARQKMTGFRGTHDRRYIVRVQEVESVPVQCIGVSGESHLYLAGRSLIPTHNSDWLLMAALQYVDVPHYSALILRKTWPDLIAPGAILDRARSWFEGLDVKKTDEGRYWTFPSGATLQFGTLQYDKDVSKYMSAEYQFIGFDELTHWREEPYKFMFSRIRKPQIQCLTCSTALKRKVRRDGAVEFIHANAKFERKCAKKFPDPRPLMQYKAAPDGMTLFDVPLRMRGASNPGSVGHQWVRNRFVEEKTRDKNAIFIPSLISDNPSLNQEEYRETLMHLSPVARERMLNGDWDVMEEGGLFDKDKFKYADRIDEHVIDRVRFWDLAATTKDKSDWTSGALVSIGKSGTWYIEDIVRGKWHPADVERKIQNTYDRDGRAIKVRMEQEGGSAGVNVISHYRRNVIPSANFDGWRANGSKEVRAGSFATQVDNGNVTLLRGQWNSAFLDEAQLFPNGEHDDQIDSAVHGWDVINHGRRTRLIV